MLTFFQRIWHEFKEYVVLVILLLFSLFILSINDSPAVHSIRTTAFGSFASATSLITSITNYFSLKKENEHLREINAGLMLHVNRLREFGIHNEELKRLLDLKDDYDYPLIPATIVAKSLKTTQGNFIINAGKDDSVKAGMPVISEAGLVGIIESVSWGFSVVRTLQNKNIGLTVKNQRSRFDGIMKWNGKDLIIVDIPKTYDVELGDRINTSELSYIFPVAIPIGIVAEISRFDEGIFNELKVKSFVDFTRVEHVFVLGIVQSKIKDDVELNFFRLQGYEN